MLNMHDFVENFVFKYLDKANDNIDEIANDVNQTIEAYMVFVKNKYFKDSKVFEKSGIDNKVDGKL